MKAINTWLQSFFRLVAMLCVLVFSHLFSQPALSDDDKIINFLQYSETFSSSGQPSEKQLKQLKKEGYKRIVYLAFVGNSTALKDEDKIVNSLGMSYLHIPVDFQNPTLADFEAFAAQMKLSPEQKTLLHCQVNYRASAFSFLYRVIFQKVPMDIAKQDMDKIWEPDAVWFNFIKNVLKQYSMRPECENCDWSAHEFSN